MQALREGFDPEGRLTVLLGWDGDSVRRVAVRSTRPLAARRLLANRAAAEAIATVPLLFSVCRRAQTAAAAGAIEAAGEKRAAIARGTAHASVLLETLSEHVSNLLRDLPRATERDPAIDAVADVRKRIDRLLQAIDCDGVRVDATAFGKAIAALEAVVAREIYGMRSARWFNLGGFDDLIIWASHGTTLPARALNDVLRETPTLGASDVALMPAIDPEALLGSIIPAMRRDAGFARTPTWGGNPVETGPLARMREHRLVSAMQRHYGSGVAARLVARLVELASLLCDAQDSHSNAETSAVVQTFAGTPGEGIAAVQTARGMLLHFAHVDDGRVADYQIVAPTEWNFHPDGALVRGIAGMAARDAAEAERRTALVAQTLDPCVALRIEVGHA